MRASLSCKLELKVPMSNSKHESSTVFTQNSDGSVAINYDGGQEVLRPWGHPDGFGCAGCHRESYNNEQRPMFLVSAIRIHGASDHATKGSAPCIDRIALSIPLEIRKAIYHLPHWPIEMIELAECFPEHFLKLIRWNPALIAVLAHHSANRTQWGAKYWGNYFLWRRPNDITRQLGLGSSCAKFLGKIKDEGLCAHGYLDLILTGWKRPGMARLLRHVPRVNLDVALTATNHWQLVRECPSLLHLAAAIPQPYSSEVYEAVEEITQMRGALQRRRWPWRKIRDIEQLRKIRKATQEAALAAGKLGEIVYPPPPVSPCSDWKWISNSTELEEIGLAMENCAASYHWRCLTGDAALYFSRHSAVEDTTMVVIARSNRSSDWQVTDVFGYANALVDEEKEKAIRRHFEGAQGASHLTSKDEYHEKTKTE